MDIVFMELRTEKTMREKVIDLVTNATKSLNSMEIMNMIKPVNTVKDYEELLDVLEELCQSGIIRVSNNGFVKNELLYGRIDEHEKGNAHLVPYDLNIEDVFINRSNMRGAHDGDIVLVDYVNKERTEGKVVRILKRSLGRALGEVINKDGNYYIKLLDKLPVIVYFSNGGYALNSSLPNEMPISQADPNVKLIDGLIVHFAYVRDVGKNQVLAKIDYAVGHKNAVGNTTKLAMIMSEFGRRFDFPQEVLDEKYPTSLSDEEANEGIKNGRVDLRGETIFTIDGKDTKDIDDAINTIFLPNGNTLQTTAIADVSYYVKPGSESWKFAEFKGNSDYPGNKVGPMLKIELSNGICSLNPNENRFSLVVQYELTPNGEIRNPNVFAAVIKSKQKMNYDAVQDIIDGKETEDTKDYTVLKYTVKKDETIDSIAFKYKMTPDELLKYNSKNEIKEGNEINIPTRQVIINNYVVSRIMKGALERRGKVDFDSKEPKYIFDDNDKVIDIKPRIQRPAEELIENHMIYANEAFAMFMIDKLSKVFGNNVPFVYRTHGDPNPKKIEDLLNMLSAYGIVIPFKIDPEHVTNYDLQKLLEILRKLPNGKVFSDKILRCMQKAKYTVENYGHFGIASTLYCHFTSPIRRMADLIVHTMYRELILENKTDKDNLKRWNNYLNDICEMISQCEYDAEKCEYAVQDYLNATFMLDKIGDYVEATIDGLMPSCFFSRTDNFIDGRVDFYLEPNDAKELLMLSDKEEIIKYIEEHKKLLTSAYDYNEKLFGYVRNGRVSLRFGDRIIAVCSGADPENRQVDFTLIRKL
jgi:ribonuclease R